MEGALIGEWFRTSSATKSYYLIAVSENSTNPVTTIYAHVSLNSYNCDIDHG